MDALPVLSQLKSLVQAICGQKEAAFQTQINFSRQCPVVSQIRSTIEYRKGDTETALETQIECGKFLLMVMNGLPVLGHVKGAVHYALGDKESGGLAMKSATHTSAVIGGGIAGMLIGGPSGSVAMGIGAGAAMDVTITAVDSAVKDEFSPFGALEVAKDPTNAGKWCDVIGGAALDGVLGRSAGGLAKGLMPDAAGIAVADETLPGALQKGITSVAKTTENVLNRAGITIKLSNKAAKLYSKTGEPIAEINKNHNIVKKRYQQKPIIDDGNNLTEKLSVPVTTTDELCVETIRGVKHVYLNHKLICMFFKEDMYYNVDGDIHKLDHELRYVMKNNGDLEEVEDIFKVDSELVSQEVDIDAQSCGSSVYYETNGDMNIDSETEKSFREEQGIVAFQKNNNYLNIN